MCHKTKPNQTKHINLHQNDLIRRLITRKGLIHRKTKQPTNQPTYLNGT